MVDQIIEDCKPKMRSSLTNLETELSRIRTGRANAAILDGVKVPYYGGVSSLKELATVSVPESNQIAVKPWDKNALSDIESAIRNSDLGINPINDGVMIRLILPAMTEDRRKEIIGQVKKHGEASKIALRNIRGEAWNRVQAGVKDKTVTEDDKYDAEEKLNKLIDEFNKEIDSIVAAKEKDVMTI